MVPSARALPTLRRLPAPVAGDSVRASHPPVRALDRVVVIGTSGSGKTTFARRLAATLDAGCVELDELFWGPEWRPKPEAEFLRLSADAAARERWVVDGNYRVARPLLWTRATAIVWLDYGFGTALLRTLRRTLRRALTRQALWHGNRESLRRSFLSRESILLWVITTHARRKREFASLRGGDAFAHADWIVFRRPADADTFLASVAATTGAPVERAGS